MSSKAGPYGGLSNPQSMKAYATHILNAANKERAMNNQEPLVGFNPQIER
jgi:hypothetical protein